MRKAWVHITILGSITQRIVSLSAEGVEDRTQASRLRTMRTLHVSLNLLAAPTPWFKRHALRPRTMRVSLPRSQELPPPNPTPPSDNDNPTLLEDRPELNASPALSALRQESKKWQDSPKEFFAAVPDSVTKYDRKSPVDFIRGTIAFRIRAGEFFRCRKTWGHRGRRAFRAHVARCKTALSSIDHARWLEFGRTTDMILRRHAAGTIVASCLLDAPEAKQYAEEFAALEKALWDYIVKDYSCLKNKIRTHRSHRTTGRPRPHGAHHNHSCNTLLSDEPHQVVFDSLAKALPPQNTDRSDPVDGQSALVDQRQPPCAIAQSYEHARMLYSTPISQQSPTQQSQQCLSSSVHNPTTPHFYSGSTAEMSSHPACISQLWPSTNTIPTAPECIGHLPQQDFATQAVTSTPLPAFDICLAGSQHCSMGSLPTHPHRMQTPLAEQITASPYMAGYEQYQSQASLSTFGRPVHDPSHLRMNLQGQFVAEVPWECVENQDFQGSRIRHRQRTV
ncbi:hypothetical protein CABS01_16775 [Colletotrichum abscissum]|uniref:uncharacterized protein n=1 Tax=Colletotrichum abscissum TaxID=1671311 RepID=UPI0027D5BAF6|nr:uncharacterized protein CABS01_16775 [Colletotrichum abscissum]KAK1513935.1 hypothetical protein CABS01_16775 [Colletotrichum abscissum]